MAHTTPDRNLALELVRVTEAAALSAARLVGRGDKEAADQAAVDGMRHVLETVSMDGVVVIGEGEKDEAPMLYNGEHVGDGSEPAVDIAVDPLEGTTLTARGMPSALAVIAISPRGTMFDPGPCVYMEKLAGGSDIADVLDLDKPIGEVCGLIAERRNVGIGDVTVVVLDRAAPRGGHHGDPRGGRPRAADQRRRRERGPARRQHAIAGRPAVGRRRHPRGRDLRGGDQGVRRRARRPAVAARRHRAPGGARRRLRPRPPAHAGRPRPRRRLLLLGDRGRPTATCCRASATRGPASPRPNRSSCARARAPCAASARGTTARSCAR